MTGGDQGLTITQGPVGFEGRRVGGAQTDPSPPLSPNHAPTVTQSRVVWVRQAPLQTG